MLRAVIPEQCSEDYVLGRKPVQGASNSNGALGAEKSSWRKLHLENLNRTSQGKREEACEAEFALVWRPRSEETERKLKS